jgi:hypothetical protein
MPKVSVDHSCTANADEAFKKIKQFFETDQDLKKLDPNIKCSFKEGDMSGKVTANQFSANIAVKPDGGGSLVSVIVDLPLLLSPFKGKVQETLEKKLKKYLA